VTWNRQTVAQALVNVLTPAVGVAVHHRPPEILNPPCVVIGRPVTVSYGIGGLGMDEASLPVIIVGGIESEDQIEALKAAAQAAILANPSLGLGTTTSAWPVEERNWVNRTGAGGIQLLTVELMLTVVA
jgi:hypothetical protein